MDDHADYVRAEWRRYHEQGQPLANLAARVVPAARRVLDVGCGAGQELLAYPQANTVGIDVRKSGILAGRALFRERGLRVPSFLVGAAEQLPFASGAFDVLICRLALPYTEVPRALAEMARVLRPGGALVLQYHSIRYYLRRAMRARHPGELAHALRVIAAGTAFELTGWQAGEVFLLRRTFRRLLERAGIELLDLDQRNPGAPLALARR